MASDASGFVLNSDTQAQTAQLRDSDVDLKPQLVQLQGDEQYRVDLREEEAQGGHALSEHVGRSDRSLLSTVGRFELPNCLVKLHPQEGSFGSYRQAEDYTNAVLDVNGAKVDKVVKEATGERQPIAARFDTYTGKEAYIPAGSEFNAARIRPTFGVEVIIVSAKNSPRGYRVVTSYPTNFDRDLP